jgi:diacylglycerol O-acyltransferase/trehalose O-mycolyltransferase
LTAAAPRVFLFGMPTTAARSWLARAITAGVAVALAVPAGPGVARAADWPDCVPRATPIRTGVSEVSRVRDGRLLTLTLRSRAMRGLQRVNVLLPAGYDPSGRTRYPVLYLLHGAGGDHRTWIERDGAAAVPGDVPVIAVMPDGAADAADGSRRNGGYSDWYGLPAGDPGPVPAWESYHVRELVPFVDRHFPTRADAAGRAVAGISMGGTGAMKYAAAHPGTFGYAGSFSGGLDSSLFRGVLGRTCENGDPAEQEVRWRDGNPTDLAANLRGVRLFVRSGDGTPGPHDAATEPADATEALLWRWRLGVESGAHRMAVRFAAALAAGGVTGADVAYHRGSHTPPYWQEDAREFAAWLGRQLRAGVRPPAEASVASADAVVTAWGWTFRTHRPVTEFLYLRLGPGGRVTLTGSGRVDVLTAAAFRPGRRYAVTTGTSTRPVRADARGRLRFTADLGPAHTVQQTAFGPEATAGWVTSATTIRPLPSRAERRRR